MSASAQIERLADGGIAIWLGGERAAVVPGAEDAAWIARLVESVEDARGQRLMLAGIVAGIALAAPAHAPHPSAAEPVLGIAGGNARGALPRSSPPASHPRRGEGKTAGTRS